MLYRRNARSLLEEAMDVDASADLLAPEAEEVKEVLDDLEDKFDNIEEVSPEDKETNNAVLTAESCPIYRINEGYAVDIRDIMRICEAEGEMEGDPDAPAADAGDVASDVAQANDVSEDELVIVAPVDVAQQIVEACFYEAKCGKKGKAAKKAKGLADVVGELQAKGFKVKKKAARKTGKKGTARRKGNVK